MVHTDVASPDITSKNDARASDVQASRREKAEGWLNPRLSGLQPYYQAPVAGNPLRLDQNTNLHGQNPAATRVDASKLSLVDYPSRDGDALLEALGDRHGLSPEHFLVANGSDEALDIITRTFAEPGASLATSKPSYSLYPFYATLQGLRFQEIPLRGDGMATNVDGLLSCRAAVTVIATPNNPTGTRIPAGELERLIQNASGVVVLDEAYIEYAGLEHSFVPRVEDYDNLIIMRTFSKAYGLAALRIGYLVANPQLMGKLRLVKPPFNLNLYSERVAIAALEEQAWVDAGVMIVKEQRDRLTRELSARGFLVTPSEANFLLTRSPIDPALIAAGLRERGVLVRTFPGKAMLEHSVRFTVGEASHTDQLLAALDALLA